MQDRARGSAQKGIANRGVLQTGVEPSKVLPFRLILAQEKGTIKGLHEGLTCRDIRYERIRRGLEMS